MAGTIYRADQVGSLLRPPELLEARGAHAEGRVTAEQLREMEDKAILEVLEMQRQVGIDVFTDGEYRRISFRSDFADAVEGVVQAGFGLEWHGRGSATPGAAMAWIAGAKLRQTRRLTAHESSFLKTHASGPCKVTLPSAGYTVSRAYKPGLTDKFYPTSADLAREIAAIIQNEIKALIDEGIPYIQLDAPGYTSFVDESQRQQMKKAGVDPDRAFEESLMADNLSLAGVKREGATLAIHLCRGNSRSRWHSQGGYDHIAEKLFNDLQLDTFLLEYDSDRAGGFEPLRFVPKGKNVVLGLITTKEGKLEPQDELLRRIEEAAKFVPMENLALSPQCGFASSAPGNLLSWDEQRRKLELVVQTAHKVWG